MSESYPHVEVTSRPALRDWLEANHADSQGIWLVTFKKAAGDRYLPYDEIVREALCFGWIDSIPRTVDEQRTRLLLTPRKLGSGWSRANKERIAELEREGLIREAGQAAIDAAKADGSWSALDAIENLEEPEDLADRLDADSAARSCWEEYPRSVKRGVLEWIQTAKRDETRRKRIDEVIEAAGAGERPGQWRRK